MQANRQAALAPGRVLVVALAIVVLAGGGLAWFVYSEAGAAPTDGGIFGPQDSAANTDGQPERPAAASDSPANAPATAAMPGPNAAGRPNFNIVIFLIDTLRADRLGAYGYEKHDTSPFIDKLARAGVVFDNAYSPAPWTLPSVASMFTSTFPCEHNVLGKYDSLPESADTLAERLKRAGYTTYSLFANEFIGSKFGMAQGFDFHRPSTRNDGRKVHAALGAQPGLPFFLYVHNLAPHNPYHFAPPHTDGFMDVSRAVRERIKGIFTRYKSAAEHDYRLHQPLGTTDMTAEQDQEMAAFRELLTEFNELYDACVLFSDHKVASTVQTLFQRKEWQNTMFILVSDHGEEMDEHGAWLHDQSVYDEVLRVPLIIRFPNDEFAGTRITESVSLMDLIPTLFDYMGREELVGLARGRSLMPLVRGEETSAEPTFVVPGMRINTTRYYAPWLTTRGNVNIPVLFGDYKGIWNVDTDTFELYDLARDPAEQTDIAEQNAELVASMRRHARSWHAACAAAARPAGASGTLDEREKENLRKLGYIE